jgi:hypothetical protein
MGTALIRLLLVPLAVAVALADEPLVVLKDSTQSAGPDNVRLDLNLHALFKDKNVPVTLLAINGRWRTGPPPPFTPYSFAVRDMKFTSERVTGELVVTIQPPREAAPGTKPTELVCRLDGILKPARAGDLPNVAGLPAEGLAFWTVMAEAQGLVGHVAGQYQVDGRTGPLTGTANLVLRPGHWDMGTFDNGLKLFFNLGTRRENWNHARIAQYELPEPRDLSRFTGLRVRVTTDKPRTDTAVSLWLREADGSWYYVKDAVSLADTQNEAVVEFEDFAEAEWVAPSNHMDEDYVLDLKTISHLGLGVVNSLGIGEVRFTVQAVELVSAPKPAPSPAALTVTGRLLSVNGHDVVPAGVFGGYAGDLPQRYRPGCQRNLPMQGPPYAPSQRFVLFRAGDILDEAAVTAGLRAYSNLLATASQPGNPGKARTLSLLGQLNFLLEHPDLDPTPAGTGIEIMKRNRRVLDAAFAGALKPLPAAGPTEEFYIECFGDRYQPPPLLTGPGWRGELQGLATNLARRSRQDGYAVHFEFWNEPYLNWAERSRIALNSRFYNTALATNGGPVTTLAGIVIPHFQWVSDGGGGLKVVDQTAFSYWAGAGLGWVYDQMLEAVGSTIKSNNPAVQVIGGWGFRWHEDHWAGWDLLYKPTIDRNIAWLDGVDEHHYQGDTTAMNGSYEVLTAYGVTKHNKWLHIYNTECNDLVDAPARGAVDTPEKAKAASKYRKMTYNLRDCLYSVAQSPDKLKARTVIHHDDRGASTTNGWTAVGYGLLRNLRGRLVETASSDDQVWCVASIDGTDPLALPPPGTPPTLVVCVWNDHRQPRTIELNLTAPAGTTFSNGVIEQARANMATFELNLDQQDVVASGTRHTARLVLPERSAWKIALPLQGARPGRTAVARTQYFAPDLLRPVTRADEFSTTIRLDRQALRQSSRAWLRIVVEDIAAGEAAVTVAGKEIRLPKALTADNVNRILDLPVNPRDLSANVPVTFRTLAGNHAGYRVDMTSIVLEHPPLGRAMQRTAGTVAPVGRDGWRE